MEFNAPKLAELWINTLNKQTKCMYGDCDKLAIKSHVMQKNGIIRQIAHENHVIHRKVPDIHELVKGKKDYFKRVGVNDVYTFFGFCNEHDTRLFRNIEDKNTLDLQNPIHQALFCYRGLCQEISRKLIVKSFEENALPYLPFHVYPFIADHVDGLGVGIKNLTTEKTILEAAINSGDVSQYVFYTTKIPRIELCISTPLNIHPDDYLKQFKDFDHYLETRPQRLANSFINIFPYEDKSYFIGGHHRDFPSRWFDQFKAKMQAGDKAIIFKELSDLIAFRLEFWFMSQKLYESISIEKRKKYQEFFSSHILDHHEGLSTDLNLFDQLL